MARLSGWWTGDNIITVLASQKILHGSLDIYAYTWAENAAPPHGFGYSYSPLVAIIVAPFVRLAEIVGWGPLGTYRVMAIPLMIMDVLAMAQLRWLARSWRPAVDERILFFGIGLALFATSFLYATGFAGKAEGMVLLFLLLTLRLLPRNLLLAGLCAGLALATKHQTALLGLIPLGLVLLAGGRHLVNNPAGRVSLASSKLLLRGLRDAVVWGSTALAVFAVFMVPAILANPQAAYYAFIVMPQRLIFLGPGGLRWADELAEVLLPTGQYEQVRSVLQYQLVSLPLVLVLLVTGAIIWAAWRQRRPISLVDTRLIGLLALAPILLIVSNKWVDHHYFQVPLVLLFLWDLLRIAPTTTGTVATLASFPWFGLGSALLYGSLRQIDWQTFNSGDEIRADWLGYFMIFLMFVGLSVVIVVRLVSDRQPREASDVQPVE